MEIKIQNENELSIVRTAFEGRIEVLRDGNDEDADRWEAEFEKMCKVTTTPVVVTLPDDIGEMIAENLAEAEWP